MKYIDIRNSEVAFSLVSQNELINVNIVDIHPELTFEDNSMLIFTKSSTYYDFISNADIFTPIDQDVNMKYLVDNYEYISDTVVDFSYNGADVTSITEFKFNDDFIYFIQRSGVNKFVE